MYEDIRITAKFKPLEEDHHHITTSTDISLPQYPTEIKKNNIRWRRLIGESAEELPHLDTSPIFECTNLDYDCLIEATFEIQKYGGYQEKKILVYGPVQNNQQFQNDISQFIVEIHLTQSRVSKCLLQFQYNQAILKNLEGQNKGCYCISFNDLSKCYIEQRKLKVIVFPTLFERIVGLKVFKQILKKGSYSDNNYPLKIIISTDTYFKAFLSKVNFIKLQKNRRTSQISIKPYKRQPKPSFPSTDVVKKSQQDSEDSFKSNKKNKILNIDKKNMKNSEFIPKQSKESNMTEGEEYPTSLQGEKNYFSEFENLLYDKDEPQAQTLVLNDSFEEFEKKSNDKDVEKLLYIKKRKEEKKVEKEKVVVKLKDRLNQLNHETSKLLSINRTLKDNLQKLSQASKSNTPDQIALYKADIYDLRIQHDRLIEDLQKLRSSEEKRKSFGRGEERQKILTKIRSQKDLDTSLL